MTDELLFANDTLNWCFSSLGCPDYGLPEIMALAKRFGISSVELRAINGSLDVSDYLHNVESEQPELFSEVVNSNMVTVLDTSFCLAKSKEDELTEFVRLAKLADRMGVRWLRVFGGFAYNMKLQPEKLYQSVKTLSQWKQVRSQQNICCELALETHDGFSSAAHCSRLWQEYGESIPIIWDAQHTYTYGGEAFDESLRILGENAVHVHVKDSVNSNGNIHSVLPGTGTVPIPQLLNLLRERNYTGAVSLEWEKKWEPDLPSLECALQAALDNWL